MERRFIGLLHRQLGMSWFTAFLCIVAVASVSLNVVLSRKMQSLTHAQQVRMTDRLLKIGANVPTMTVKGLDGNKHEISYKGDSKSTVLYIFTPTCSWCARNMDNFKLLLDKERSQYRFVGVSLAEVGLREYLAKNDLELPVYSGLSAETLKTYKLGSTPQTIVISPEGKVVQNWVGAYAGDQESKIEGFFHVSLPGLRQLQEENEKKAAN